MQCKCPSHSIYPRDGIPMQFAPRKNWTRDQEPTAPDAAKQRAPTSRSSSRIIPRFVTTRTQPPRKAFHLRHRREKPAAAGSIRSGAAGGHAHMGGRPAGPRGQTYRRDELRASLPTGSRRPCEPWGPLIHPQPGRPGSAR